MVEQSRVLGLAAFKGRPKWYVDPDPRLGSATEVARRLGVSRRAVFNRRRRPCLLSTHPSSAGPRGSKSDTFSPTESKRNDEVARRARRKAADRPLAADS